MTRPSDWWVLDLDADPTPGDPERLNTLARRLRDFADTVSRARGAVESLQGDDAVLAWVGISGDAFREQFGEFPGQLRKLHLSHQMAGDALHTYAPCLESAQAQADRALADGREARHRLTTTTGQLNLATDAFDSASQAATRLSQSTSDTYAPDPAQVRQATRDAESARARLSSAQSAVDSAQQALDAAKALAAQAQQVRDTAARECVRDIDQASEVGIQPRSFWEKLGKALTVLWDIVCEVAKWVALVAGVIAMIIGGPMAWVALAAGAVLLVKAIVDFAQGKNSIMDLVFGILGVIPGVKGLTSLSKLASLYKAGGLKEIGKAALGSMKDLAKGMATTVRDLGHKAITVVKDGLSDLANKINDLPLFTSRPSKAIPSCGDPVDVTTGRMFLTETDVERATEPSLLLTRSHRSDYRAGRCFGPTWSSTLDQRVQIEGDLAHVVAGDGMLLTYPLPETDAPVLPEYGAVLPLRRNRHGEFLLTDPGTGYRMVFDAPDDDGTAPLSVVVDPAGGRVWVVRDSLGTPIEVRHSDGHRVAVETSEAGLVTALRLLPGSGGGDQVTLREFRYDEHRRLTEVVNERGAAMRYEYDDEGRVTRWTDRNGMWYRYTYDPDGRCVQTEGRDGYMNYRFSYDSANGITRATDSLGHTRTYQLNDRLQVVAETDPLGATTYVEWDARDRLLSRTDPLGRTTRLHYDEDGIATSVTRPDGSTVLLEYGDRRLTADLGGGMPRVLAAEVVAGDEVWRREYDLAEAPDPSTESIGTVAPTRAEEIGARERPVPPTHAYDIEIGYDGEGNETAFVDPLGQVTRAEYAGFDLVVATVDVHGARTTYTYDTELRLTEVTNPRGLVWTFTYDPAGRVVGERDFDGRVVEYRYDQAGQLVGSVNALGELVEYRYDLLGNMVERISPAGRTGFEYDPVGRLVGATGPDGVLRVERDDEGRVCAETINGRTVAVTYDEVNRQIHRLTPSGVRSVWTYAAAGHPVALHVAGREVEFAHDSMGRETRRRLDGGFVLTQEYESGHGLTTQTMTRGDATVQRRRYSYRPGGAVTEVDDELGGPVRFQLDAAGRVTEATGPDRAERYQYDADGNISGFSVAGDSGSSTSVSDGERVYDGTRLVRAGAVTYRYDAAGRLVEREEPDGRAGGATRLWRFTWNADDRLTEVTTPEGARWRYRYDPLGRRISKQRCAPESTQDADVETVVERVDFAWHGPLLVEAEHTGPDTAPRALTWEHHPYDDRPVIQTRHQGGTVEHFAVVVTDVVGAPAELVDADGAPVWQARSSLWGAFTPAPADAVDTPLRFPGQYHDPETGLHYNVYRFYDPATGRYTSPDPLGLGPGPNPVAYVSNPLSAVDPLGLTRCKASGGRGAGKSGGDRIDPIDLRRSSRSKRPSETNLQEGAKEAANSARSAAASASASRLDELRKLDPDFAKRTLNQGGGTEFTAKLDRFSTAGGYAPQPRNCTDVTRLNKAPKSLDQDWIRGHLLNDNLGGPGLSPNLTPLTSAANAAMKNHCEKALKDAVAIFQRHPDKSYGIDFKVSVSESLKFPHSTRVEERSIREFLEFDVRYTGLNADDISRLGLPELPPVGTTMDTVSGAFTTPRGTPWPPGRR